MMGKSRRRDDILREAIANRWQGVTSNDDGLYTCHSCGEQWPARSRHVWWPIRVRLTPQFWPLVSHHGWEIGCDRIEQRVYGHTVRIGPVLVVFGNQHKFEACAP